MPRMGNSITRDWPIKKPYIVIHYIVSTLEEETTRGHFTDMV